MRWSICLGSMMRHTVKRALGERIDPETGMLHTAAIACNALFLCAYDVRGMHHLDDLEPYARGFRRRKKVSR
jgi:hypothetical protein